VRLLGQLDDVQTAITRKEPGGFVPMVDLAAVDGVVVERATSRFAVNVRALDAIQVAELLRAEVGAEWLALWMRDDRQANARFRAG
jgi:hypothetical protein